MIKLSPEDRLKLAYKCRLWLHSKGTNSEKLNDKIRKLQRLILDF
jgi:hypothetical protein